MQNRFISQAIINFIQRRMAEIFGLCLFLAALGLTASLLSYSSKDISFNTATQNTSKNWIPEIGSYTSDLLFQSFGVPAFFWIGLFGFWGIRFIRHEMHLLSIKRYGSGLLSLFGFGVILTALPWLEYILKPLYALTASLPHAGGFIGYLIYAKLLNTMTGHGVGYLITPILFFILILSVWLFWYALGFSFRQLTNALSRIYNLVITVSVFCGQFVYTLVTIGRKHVDHRLDQDHFLPEEGHERANIQYETMDEVPDLPSWASFDEEAMPCDLSDGFDRVEAQPKTAKAKPKKSDFVLPTHLLQTGEYTLPPLDLLDKTVQKCQAINPDALQEQARLLESVLNEFGIRGDIVNIRPGPVVTMYELKPAPGIKTSRVIGLADDIARSMSALSARIAVSPGQNVIGIELPNRTRQTVFLRELLNSKDYSSTQAGLPLILGQDIGGHPTIADLAKMPHLLVAGTTGSGKSVSVNAMILSLLFKLPPSKCKFIMIDPKMLELSVYDDIPHLLTPVVTDPKKAVVALKWAVKEMENRYRAMSKLGVRNIDGFNTRLTEARKTGEVLVRRVQTGFDPETGKPIFENQGLDYETLPYIVVVVDEMADLMLVAGKEIEATIQRLAQMARAAGIHLIMATQRPSVDVITGTIKANFPTRISFQVTSKIDSRTILSEQGAEQLLGQGDMLYMAGGGRISRVHGPYVRDDEVERIVSFLKLQGEPTYIDGVTDDDEEVGVVDVPSAKGDQTYQQALDVIRREGKVSTSFIQRHLQIGYNRAARIVEQMEKEGVISAPNHSGKREIL